MYAKLNNGVLEYAPQNYKLNDGRTIVGFNKSIALMTRYGFKEVIDQQPTYDAETEYLVITGYTEQDTTITIVYAVKQMDLVEQELTIDEKIVNLQNVDTEHELALAELTEMVLNGGAN
ncbi:hypothetical protein [Intestinibacter bartlettii]|uniref:hypothetical protein n=1 Tax=Intestinibacter bartlettii TaxID=261299 RepID=UPI000820F222|nr:hypothetical protein [Intestinibacter bartlettii]SCI51358.1 Uncharacterised protein [uncultured Clostridium sp.]